MPENNSIQISSVYGPVSSWRLGRSLGIDLNLIDSICSFRCIYCQLGKINRPTSERGLFVSTEKVIADLQRIDYDLVDCITISGNGEPTLAINLGEVIEAIKKLTGLPVVVLTNSTLLYNQDVRDSLAMADKVFCKLDAATERSFRLVDRPVEGVSLQMVLDGIRAFRQEYDGFLATQTMLLPIITAEIQALASILADLGPDEIQLNLPSRPVPRNWIPDWRGNHDRSDDGATRLKILPRDEVEGIVAYLRMVTGLNVVSPRMSN